MNADDDAHRRMAGAGQVMYLSGDCATHEAIVRVLDELPPDAGEVATGRCVFLSVGGAGRGQCLETWVFKETTGRDWLILLDDRAADLENVVAEEVAHAYDLAQNPDPWLSSAEREKRARELMRKWGFTPLGADS